MKGKCEACGQFDDVDRAHIRTRGAGAGWNEEEWIFLCRKHHVMQGQIGWNKLIRKFPNVANALNKRGFEVIFEFGRWKLRKNDI